MSISNLIKNNMLKQNINFLNAFLDNIKKEYLSNLPEFTDKEKVKKDSMAFLYLATKFISDKSFDIDQYITEASDDEKIDAIYYDIEYPECITNDSSPKLKDLYYIQSTISENLQQNKIELFINNVKNLFIDKDQSERKDIITNRRITEIQEEISKCYTDMRQTKLAYIFKGDKNNSKNKDIINEIRKRYNDPRYCINFYDIGDIIERMQQKTKKYKDYDFEFTIDKGTSNANNYIQYSANNIISTWIFIAKATEIVDLIDKCKQETNDEKSLFDKNIRNFLGYESDVNKEIAKTIQSDDKRYFSIFNNGITIVTEGVDPKDWQGNFSLIIKNPCIVNGLQTAKTIYEEYIKNKRDDYKYRGIDGVNVMIKVYNITVPKDELINKITKGTNTQNKIETKDLISNDNITIKAEEFFKQYGFTYIRKEEFENNDTNSIPHDIALQKWYAVYKNPTRAKQYKDAIIQKFYRASNYKEENEVFESIANTDKLILEIFYASVIYLKLVKPYAKSLQIENKWIIHCQDLMCYTIAKLLNDNIDIVKNLDQNSETLNDIKKTALSLLSIVWNINENEYKKTPANFFKSKLSTELIDSEIEKLTSQSTSN